MARLIDTVELDSRAEVDGRWFIAKPLPGPLLSRIRDAWMVLRGRAEAFVFAQDRPDLARAEFSFRYSVNEPTEPTP